MAEEAENPESFGAPGVDPVAFGAAMGRASPKVDEELTAYLAEQRHHIAAQFAPQMRQLYLGIWEKRLGVLLRIATAFVGLAVAAGVALMIWNATQSNGLLIEPFSVPPDLAERGMTGEVVAAKLLDGLAAMQAQTSSQRAPATYANSWSQKDIKLDIPETGVSLTELDNFLREKLGHDTRISGEIVRTPSGLSITARAGGDGAESIKGSDADLDTLVQLSGESIYGMTQPYRYAIYLTEHGRVAEAIPDFMAQARTGSAQERSWSYLGWALASLDNDGVDAQLALLERSIAASPDNSIAWIDITEAEDAKSHPEQSLADCRKILSLLSSSDQRAVRADLVPAVHMATQSQIDLQLGAFHDAAQEQADVVHAGLPGRFGISARLAWAQAGEHDLAAARATMANSLKDAGIAPGMEALYRSWARILIDSEAENWPGVLSEASIIGPLSQKLRGVHLLMATTTTPAMAYAQAKQGDIIAAEARIAGTPSDCYVCLRTRARIAESKGDRAGADLWFSRAVQTAPSIPLAYSEWGQALLERGARDAAIAKFKIANQKGPHFADPLEGWGEALIAQNRSDLALVKFTQAEPYAPNWGRLHLKWGEALGYAGERDEAKKQFAQAAQLDLSLDDKAELAKVSHG